MSPWQIGGIIFTGFSIIIGWIISSIWMSNKMAFYAGQFLAKVDHISGAFTRFENDFSDHMAEEKKRAEVMWGKIDLHSEKLVEHHQRLVSVEKKAYSE